MRSEYNVMRSYIQKGFCAIASEGMYKWFCKIYILAEKTLSWLRVWICLGPKVDVVKYHWFWPKSL